MSIIGLLLSPVIASAAVTLENGSLTLAFADAKDGFALTGIVCRTGAPVRFLSPSGSGASLWAITIARNQGKYESFRLTNRNAARQIGIERTADGADFVWQGLDLPGEPGALDVRAQVRFVDDASEWTLVVSNRSAKGWTLFDTRYPYLRRVMPAGSGDVLMPAKTFGARLIRGFGAAKLEQTVFESPSTYPMVTAFQLGEAGLYVAAHDRESRIKGLNFTADQGVFFQTAVENALLSGKTASGPGYPVVIAVYRGDWWQVARRYRKFAMTCPWTAKGPIAMRSDYPRRMTDIGVWGVAEGDFGVATNHMSRLYAAFGHELTVGCHWYNWSIQGHDADYPEYRAQPGVREAIAANAARKMVTMPYFNGLLWDMSLSSYAYARDDVCVDPIGRPFRQHYNHRDFALMCPATPRWQDILFRGGTNLVSRLGADALYYDQIACSHAVACYNPAHGHPLGGGRFWAEGYRRVLTRIHDWTSVRNVPITSEGCGETWMDLIDGHLVCGYGLQNGDVPFLPAVYSGYTVFWGLHQHSEESLPAHIAVIAQTTLWGCVTGRWRSSGTFNPNSKRPVHADKRAAILRFSKDRLAAREFLVFGHLEDDLRPLDPLPRVTFETVVGGGGRPPPVRRFDFPAVIGSVWRNVKGSRRAVFAANVSESVQTVRFRLPEGAVGAEAFPFPDEPQPQMTVRDGVVTLILQPFAFVGAVTSGL